jgi:hypothetical protein
MSDPNRAAVAGFMRPEGIVIFHKASGQLLKEGRGVEGKT